MKRLLLSAVILLAGCATQQMEARRLIESGQYSSAIAVLQQEVQRGNVGAFNDLGVAYMRSGDRAKAVQMYTLAARYGDPVAQQNLASLGESIPPADLAGVMAQRRSAQAAQTAATLQFMRALQPPPVQLPPIQPPAFNPTINCSSYRYGNSVQTQCR